MRYLMLFTLTVLLFCSCNFENVKTEKLAESAIIDTVKVKNTDLDEVTVLQDSEYPHISGTNDSAFQKRLNTIFIENFFSFVDTSNVAKEKMRNKVTNDYESINNMPINVYGSFEILTNTNYIVSIIQNFTAELSGFGCGVVESRHVTNCDINKCILLTNSDLKINEIGLETINNRIINFFNHSYPEDAKTSAISYPTIESKSTLDSLDFAIKNDSIILFLHATPTAGYSRGTYAIPICKWSR
jgi:hypothetical protein